MSTGFLAYFVLKYTPCAYFFLHCFQSFCEKIDIDFDDNLDGAIKLTRCFSKKHIQRSERNTLVDLYDVCFISNKQSKEMLFSFSNSN